MRRLLLALCLLLSATIVHAQMTSCAQTLRLANSIYEQGRLHEIPALLESCLKSGFTKQEKVQAYKILCLSYLYLEEPQKADEAMLNLLRTDPYFEINEQVDPAELIGLYKTFRTWPIYRIGVRLGANVTSPNVKSRVEATSGESEYVPNYNIQFGIVGEVPLNQKLTLNPELAFQSKKFSYKSTVDFGDDQQNASEGVESQTWVSLPVMVQYRVLDKSYNPYIALGVSADYLLKSELTITRRRENASPVDEKSIDLEPEREPLNISAIAGAGVQLPIGGGFVALDVRYAYGITNVNSKTTAFNNASLALDYGYADNIFSVNSLSVTVGYIYNIFKPKKLRRNTK